MWAMEGVAPPCQLPVGSRGNTPGEARTLGGTGIRLEYLARLLG
jgi:hypothetical protein